jgi:hypothetical protein
MAAVKRGVCLGFCLCIGVLAPFSGCRSNKPPGEQPTTSKQALGRRSYGEAYADYPKIREGKRQALAVFSKATLDVIEHTDQASIWAWMFSISGAFAGLEFEQIRFLGVLLDADAYGGEIPIELQEWMRVRTADGEVSAVAYLEQARESTFLDAAYALIAAGVVQVSDHDGRNHLVITLE